IHDRGLGMSAEALLDANLRLAETPEFELSDTDRLGLFVISRLAQRQNVRVSLQPSPYGGTTAVVFLPDALLTDDVPDTNGVGFRLDRQRSLERAGRDDGRGGALPETAVQLPGLPVSVLDGPVELEAPVDLDAIEEFADALDDEDGDGGLFRPRRSVPRPRSDETTPRDVAGHRQHPGLRDASDRTGDDEESDGDRLVPLPQRRTPKLVSSHGRPVTGRRTRRDRNEGKGGAARADEQPLTPLPSRRRGESP
ncbi:histidine kinase, partial [Streptomyces sp. SID89]|nr:histidine kinase [Streptomyces sp. SID89]